MIPVFMRVTNKGESFPLTYYAPKNDAAYYITCMVSEKYLTSIQLFYLTKAQVTYRIDKEEMNVD